MIPKTATIMTVAGSDSGGGAGIQADLKTITVLGAFGVSAITALTAQNGLGVRGIHAPEPEFVALQLRALLEGFPVAAAKTGMLFSAPIIETVADILRHRNFPLVVDPVAVSQSGHKLLEDSALEALIRRIVPLADVLTPNKPEAEALSGIAVASRSDLEKAGARLLDMGAKAVLIKGGHFDAGDLSTPENTVTDWLFLPGRPVWALAHRRVDTVNNHGTGCTLSAAMATFIGQGKSVYEAVRDAQRFLEEALAAAFAPGLGTGPPNFAAGAAALRRGS